MLSVSQKFFVVSIMVAFTAGVTLFAQRPPDRSKLIEAKPQPAQTITIDLSADLVTALETLRLNTREAAKTDDNGVTTQKPMFPDVQSLVMAALSGQGGFFRQVLQKYPPAGIKASQEAAAKAKKEADAAAEKALK